MAVSTRTRAARWGGALLVALAPLPWLGFGSAMAADGDPVYATVTGHEPFSSAANKAGYWGDNCEKIVDGGSLASYVLTQDYVLVVVKAASKNVDPYTNTLFANASAGETVWADTNGNETFDPGGKGGDKAISHIIVCEEEETDTPTPTTEEPSPSTSISTSESVSPSTSISTSESVSPSTSISTSPTRSPSTSASVSPSTSISTDGTASPSTSISTDESGSPDPSQSTSDSESADVTESESSGAAALPQTGSGAPVAGALGISLLLIGVGVLLLLGPGRLIPATYHRKH